MIVTLFGVTVVARPQSFRPKNGFIPDEQTALRVGEAILEAIYGEKEITAEEPFTATLKNDIWTVVGSFPKGERFGGVATIKVSKANGRVISVTHGQ